MVVKRVIEGDGGVGAGEAEEFTFVRSEGHLPGVLPLFQGI